MNECPPFVAVDGLQKFDIRLGFVDQAHGKNPLCWKQDSPASARSTTFKCQSGPAVGRYLSVEKNATDLVGYLIDLNLCEVVVIGGTFIIFGK